MGFVLLAKLLDGALSPLRYTAPQPFKDKHLLFSLLPIVVSRADSGGARRALDVHCVCTVHALVQSEFWVLTILWLAPYKPPTNKST